MNPFTTLLRPIIVPIRNPFPHIRQEAYKRLNPYGGYNISSQLEDLSIKSKKDLPEYIDDVEMDSLDIETADELWAEYLNIPKNRRRFPESNAVTTSKYAPKNGKIGKYKSLKLKDLDKLLLVDLTDNLKIGQNRLSEVFAHKNMGVHTIGKGVDPKRGEYRSYYDRWDLNPLNGKYGGLDIPIINKADDISFGIGNPVNIYDRLYLNDYYEVDSKSTAPNKGDYYGGYIPEIIVKPKDELDSVLESFYNQMADKKNLYTPVKK